MATTASSTAPTRAASASHLVVLRGAVASAPVVRDLGSSVAHQFDLRTTDGAGSATVPVNWYDPPARDVSRLVVGEEMLVVGTVQRRFFRVGGSTQSRTEVVPERVVPLRRRAAVRSAVASVIELLSEASG